MAKAKTKIIEEAKNILRAEYNRLRKNLISRRNKAKKRGYFWSTDIVPKLVKEPTEKSIAKLKERNKDFYKRAKYSDLSDMTGTVISGEKALQKERSKSAKKGAETRQKRKQYYSGNEEGYQPRNSPLEDEDIMARAVIDLYYKELSKWNDDMQSVVRGWLEALRAEHGDTDVAKMLDEGRRNGLILTWEEAYDEDALAYYLNEMLDYLPEAGDFTKDAMRKKINDLMDTVYTKE